MENNFEDTIAINNSTISQNSKLIKNVELEQFVQFKINKNDFTKEDLSEITDIILNGKTITGNLNKIYWSDLEQFPKLNKIEISNAEITEKSISHLKNVESITFRNCSIHNLEELTNLTELILISSQVDTNFENISLLTKLKHLELIDLDIENFSFLTKLPSLEKLAIKNINNFELNKINFSLPISYLSVEDVESLPIDVISNFEKLQTLSIDRLKEPDWKNELSSLIENNKLKILLNDIYEY